MQGSCRIRPSRFGAVGVIVMSDIRAQQAREHHRHSKDSERLAEQHRSARNALVRALRADDPAVWTYRALAGAVGCTEELIAAIIQGRVP